MSNVTNPNTAPFSGGPSTIDYSAFSGPIDRSRVREFKRIARANGEPWATLNSATIIIGIVVTLGVVVFISVLSSVFASMLRVNNLGGASLIPAIAPFVLIAAASLGFLAWFGASRKKWARWYRLNRFANTNGFTATPVTRNPAYGGVIFTVGSARTSVEHVASHSGRYFDIGNYRYTTGAGKSRTTHDWGYLAIRLDRRLPHMVLDARVNNGTFGGSNLPTRFTADQVLSLEGDFNSYFTLYCPREYERDALYLFTPDLMALFIDNAASFDVEIVDDWMFVYSRSPLNVLNPAMWQRMFQIIQTVGSKTVDQSEHYRDERVVPVGTPPLAAFAASSNRIAPEGQRLRKRVSWVSIVVVVGLAAFWYFTFFAR